MTGEIERGLDSISRKSGMEEGEGEEDTHEILVRGGHSDGHVTQFNM